MRKFLLGFFLIVLVIALFYKSPFSAMYNYNKARALYNSGQYEQSLPYFEKSLFADSKGILARFFYVMALSKSKSTYSVQKKLYEMANSKIEDEATKYAKYQLPYIRHKLLENLEDNYIYNASMGKDILRWDLASFPLSVYVEVLSDVPSYYYDNIRRAMQQWTSKTNFVKFTEVMSPEEADIVINFKDMPSDVCTEAVCRYSVANTEPKISSNLLKKMVLTFYKTNPRKENFSTREIYNTALHELGHTLGILGHSDNPFDIMYSSQEGDSSYFLKMRSEDQFITLRDLKTLVLLYRIAPSISNVKKMPSENAYYAPLIMGNNDLRLQKKLEEYQRYIQKYPSMASGYINIASVYVDMGDYKSALDSLWQAGVRAKSKDENYLVHYNRAIIYFNQQDYTQALESAQKAKEIKDDRQIQDLIDDIQKFTEK